MPSDVYLRPKVFVSPALVSSPVGGRIRFFFALGRSGEMIGLRAASLSSRTLFTKGQSTCRLTRVHVGVRCF